MPEWLKEFRENLVYDASSSHGSSKSLREVWIWVNTVFFTLFPNDRNCEICHKTKITRAPCRRRITGVVLRAENVGELTTAYHKVLSEGCEF